mmetsp:Transcript_14560/g.23761  ORF Transcript_14560/g.23761 Transcript_14560/m.23761 type:complete len:95 (+) Transcript_14560:275-559(+)
MSPYSSKKKCKAKSVRLFLITTAMSLDVTGEAGGDHLAELEAYSPRASIPAVSDSLRVETGGSASFASQFSHYQAVMMSIPSRMCGAAPPHRHE